MAEVPHENELSSDQKDELATALGSLCVMFQATAEMAETMLVKAEEMARGAGVEIDVPEALKSPPSRPADPGDALDPNDYSALLTMGWTVRHELAKLEGIARRLAAEWE